MKWNEWWTANYPDGAGYSISEVSWNAALEEAAIQALACMNPEPKVSASQVHHDPANVMARKIAAAIRSMKAE